MGIIFGSLLIFIRPILPNSHPSGPFGPGGGPGGGPNGPPFLGHDSSEPNRTLHRIRGQPSRQSNLILRSDGVGSPGHSLPGGSPDSVNDGPNLGNHDAMLRELNHARNPDNRPPIIVRMTNLSC